MSSDDELLAHVGAWYRTCSCYCDACHNLFNLLDEMLGHPEWPLGDPTRSEGGVNGSQNSMGN